MLGYSPAGVGVQLLGTKQKELRLLSTPYIESNILLPILVLEIIERLDHYLYTTLYKPPSMVVG